MKKRNGFVSNSSSTSFFFLFESDDMDRIKKVLNKYKDKFNLSHHMIMEEVSCTGDEVIYEITRNINIEGNLSRNVDFIIKELNKDLERIKGYGRKTYYTKIRFNEILCLLNGLKDAKNNGLEYLYVINFGNEEGNDNVNYLMDLKSDSLTMREDDLYIITEDNH